MAGNKPTDPAIIEQAKLLLADGVSQSEVARRLGIHRCTLDRNLDPTARERFNAARTAALRNQKQAAQSQRTQSPQEPRNGPQPHDGADNGVARVSDEDGEGVRQLAVTDAGGICSVADLLAKAGVDPLSVVILDQSHNAWTTPGPDGTVLQMHQVKARVATKAEHLYRPATPVRFASLPIRPMMASKTAAFIPDTQIGFVWDRRHRHLDPLHDRRAMDAAWQMVAAAQPEIIFLLGDMLDLASASTKFPRPATYNQTIQPSIDELYWWLARLRAECPDSQIVYQAGNHEARLGKLVDERASELGGLCQAGGKTPLLSLRHLLRLDELDIRAVEVYGDGTWLWKGETETPMLVHHGEIVGGGSNGTAKKTAARGRYHSVFGHVHRNESYSATVHGPDGVYHVHTITPGCLCRVDGSVPGVTRSPDWQQGLGFATLVSGTVHPELVAIQDGCAVRGGSVTIGQERAVDIARDLDWPQMVRE